MTPIVGLPLSNWCVKSRTLAARKRVLIVREDEKGVYTGWMAPATVCLHNLAEKDCGGAGEIACCKTR